MSGTESPFREEIGEVFHQRKHLFVSTDTFPAVVTDTQRRLFINKYVFYIQLG